MDVDKFGRSVCPCGYGSECAIHCGNGHKTGKCPGGPIPREVIRSIASGEVEVSKVRDYISQFKIPPKDGAWQCNDPERARFTYLHTEDNCPYHRNRPDRRGIIPSKYDRDWLNWYGYREAFAHETREAERAYFLEKMLECVTETNPPDAPLLSVPKPRTKVKTWYDIDDRPHTYTKIVGVTTYRQIDNFEIALALIALAALIGAIILTIT